MKRKLWTYDLAREQAPSFEHLRRLVEVTKQGSYSGIGLYLEHRFAYPSTPWAHGEGCLTPEAVRQIQSEFPEVEIVPFVNLLGHYEGILYTEHGKRYREERFKGLQACPSCTEFVDLANLVLDDVLEIFTSDLVHLGGDETAQLGRCPACQIRVSEFESAGSKDGKARLYGQHFGALCRRVLGSGRTPALWADIFLEHPSALEFIPKETILFDWQYAKSPLETSRKFVDAGFQVVCCPTLHVYNAAWMHLPQSERNVRDAAAAARELDAHGVCLTTWEGALMANYETIYPAVVASGKLFAAPGNASDGEYCDEVDAPRLAEEYGGDWARLMGIELNALGGPFAYTGIRSGLKCRLLLYSNPFLAWMHHGEALCGEIGTKAMVLADHATQVAPDANYRAVAQFVRKAVEFVRYAEQARQAYAQGLPGVSVASLAPCRQIFEDLEKIALANHINCGGSLADIHRCRRAREHVETVIRRIKEFGDGSLGYLPAFEIITHPKFMPHDQGSWWLINSWANE